MAPQACGCVRGPRVFSTFRQHTFLVLLASVSSLSVSSIRTLSFPFKRCAMLHSEGIYLLRRPLSRNTHAKTGRMLAAECPFTVRLITYSLLLSCVSTLAYVLFFLWCSGVEFRKPRISHGMRCFLLSHSKFVLNIHHLLHLLRQTLDLCIADPPQRSPRITPISKEPSSGIQIITGVTLAMHYNANVLEALPLASLKSSPPC